MQLYFNRLSLNVWSPPLISQLYDRIKSIDGLLLNRGFQVTRHNLIEFTRYNRIDDSYALYGAVAYHDLVVDLSTRSRGSSIVRLELDLASNNQDLTIEITDLLKGGDPELNKDHNVETVKIVADITFFERLKYRNIEKKIISASGLKDFIRM